MAPTRGWKFGGEVGMGNRRGVKWRLGRLCRPGKSWHHGDDGGPFVWRTFKTIGQFNIFPCSKGSLFIFQRSLKYFSIAQSKLMYLISYQITYTFTFRTQSINKSKTPISSKSLCLTR